MIIPVQSTALLHIDQIVWVYVIVITVSMILACGTTDLK